VVCNAGFNREPQGLVTRNCHNFIWTRTVPIITLHHKHHIKT
jgi:hypothetical protein